MTLNSFPISSLANASGTDGIWKGAKKIKLLVSMLTFHLKTFTLPLISFFVLYVLNHLPSSITLGSIALLLFALLLLLLFSLSLAALRAAAATAEGLGSS
jgi:hypothetical protein